ncbi:hypothetical protein [Inquilinus sp. CAU 1745]|uniref:hypothetical protein n=1 Tax=Inquilinus sp. CAU 1745 TaxID=3140369 RepID=UPI00325C3190
MSLRRIFRANVALVSLSVALGSAAVDAAEVQGEDRGLFGRLTFDFGSPVDPRIVVGNDRILLDFDQPVDASLDGPARRLANYLSGAEISGDGTEVVLHPRRPIDVQATPTDTGVAIQLSMRNERRPVRSRPSTFTEAPPAETKEGVIGIRTGQHPGYSRVVFDWTSPVDYSVDRHDGSVTIAFDRAASVDLSLAPVRRLSNIRTIVPAAGDDGLAIVLGIPADSRIRHFKDDMKIVVDILDPAGQSAPLENPVVPDSLNVAPPPVPEPPVAEPAAVEPPAPESLPEPAPVLAQAESSPPEFSQLELSQPEPAAGPSAQVEAEAVETPSEAPVVVQDPVPLASPPPIAMPPAEDEAPPAEVAPPLVEEPAVEPTIAERLLREGAEVPPPETAEPAGPERAVFDPGAEALTAVFERAGGLWVVFASPDRIDPDRLADGAEEALGEAEIVPAEGGVALRFPIDPSDPEDTVVTTEGDRWIVTRSPSPPLPSEPLSIVTQPDFTMGARLFVEADGAGGLVRLIDPVMGDVLLIAPLPDAGRGLPEGRRFAEVALLPSAQGLVAQPLSDAITLRIDREGVEITTADGLRLSTPVDRRGALVVPAVPGEALYLPVSDWQVEPGQYNRRRQELQAQLAQAPEEEKNRARLDLARFFFAKGFGPEALAQLDLMAESAPTLASNPDFAMLRGAARVLAGDEAGAEEDLSLPALSRSPEAELWRASLAADRGDWTTAAEGFAAAGDLTSLQPPPFRERFALQAAKAALETGAIEIAEQRLDYLSTQTDGESDRLPAVAYMTGRIAETRDEEAAARAAYARAAESDDALYRTLAEARLVDLRLAAGEITAGEAAERLEGLRYAWRGDSVEFDILDRLGRYYWQAGQHREALETWGRALDDFPELPAAEELTEHRRKVVADLFTGEGLSALSPLVAMALYEDYRPLMPSGVESDRIVERLAERLVEVDLLERAGNLLQQLVAGRLEGQEKARVGARLAGIRLLDNDPEEALDALDESEMEGELPEALVSERRLLRARALSELERPADAFAALGDDASHLAEIARADIAWKAEDWPVAAAALSRLVGEQPASGGTLDPQRTDLVLKLAIALALADDRAGLADLAERFGDSMAGTERAEAFAVLTRPNAAIGVADLTSIQRQVAEVDLFQEFLESYRVGTPAVATN